MMSQKVIKIAIIGLIIQQVFCQVAYTQEKPEVVVTQGHSNMINDLEYSEDGRYLVTAGEDRMVKVWDLGLQQEFRTLYGHTNKVNKVAFVNQDKHIVSSCKSHILVWEHPSGKLHRQIRINTWGHSFEPIPNSTQVLVKLDDHDDANYGVLDILTGELIATNNNLNAGMIYEPHPVDSTYVMLDIEKQTFDNIVFDLGSYNLYTGKKEKTFEGGKDTWKLVKFNSKGTRMAAAELSKGGLKVWDYETTKVLMDIKLKRENIPADLRLDQTGKHLWTITQLGKILIYEVKTGKVIDTYHDLAKTDKKTNTQTTCISSTIDFSPDYKTLAVGAYLRQLSLDKKNNNQKVFVNTHLLDTKKGKIQAKLKGDYKQIKQLEVGAKSRYILSLTTGQGAGLRMWNMKDAEIQRYMPRVQRFGLSKNGEHLVTAEPNYENRTMYLTTWSFPDFVKKYEHQITFKEIPPFLYDLEITDDGETVITSRRSDYTNKNNQYLVEWTTEQHDMAAKKTTVRQKMPHADGWFLGEFFMSADGTYLVGLTNKLEYKVFNLEVNGVFTRTLDRSDYLVSMTQFLDFVPNKNQVLLAVPDSKNMVENKAYNAYEMYSKLAILDLDDGSLVVKDSFPHFKGYVKSGQFSPDGSQLIIGNDDHFGDIKWYVSVVDWEQKKTICEMEGHKSGVSHVRFDHKGKRIYSASLDGFIKVWKAKSCTLQASMLAMDELNYLILSPDDYYKSSKGNYDGLCYRYLDKLYTFDQFDIRYNRPDKVLSSLGASKYAVKIYTKAWEKRIRRMGFTPEMLEGKIELPQLDWVNKQDLPLSTTNRELTLKINATDKKSLLAQLQITVNDVPVNNKKFDLQQSKTHDLEDSYSIKLSKGANLIKVSVFNEQGLESVRESIEINYQPKATKQPDLYIYAIGVSKFKDAERNLKFATKDAKDLIEQFKKSSYYGNIIVKTIFDEAATKDNIVNTADFLKKAAVDDQIMIYVSSHGLLNDNLDYFLATHDVDFDDPTQNGLAYTQINEMLNTIDCRNRLIMIDACHSGEVDKEEEVERKKITTNNPNVTVTAKAAPAMVRPKAGLKNSFTYMKALFSDVTKGTGATVISAAGGYEFALESDDWNNGVFTYAILDGLKSAKADLNEDKIITVLELKNYVTLKVVELTNGKQHPTTRSENALNNFRLY